MEMEMDMNKWKNKQGNYKAKQKLTFSRIKFHILILTD